MLFGLLKHASAGVTRVTDHIMYHLRLGVVLAFDELWIDGLDGIFEERFGFALIQYRVVAPQADGFPVHAKDTLRDAVKGTTPELVFFDAG